MAGSAPPGAVVRAASCLGRCDRAPACAVNDVIVSRVTADSLMDAVAAAAAGTPIRAVNAGVSGDTSAAGRARLAWVLNALKRKPDLVIVELGANDMLRGLSPAQTRANLDAILAELKRRQIRVLVAGMRAAPNMGKAYAAQFEPIYPQLARKHGATLYPFFLTGVAARWPLLQADGMHPNPRGVEVVVRGIAPQVGRLLK